MFNASIMDDFRSFRRSWLHHTGMQLATLSVLTATFAVVVFVVALGTNLKKIAGEWGDRVQLTAYLKDDVSSDQIEKLKASISAMGDVSKTEFVGREAATEHFKTEMASYAPNLLSDSDFANPFPASFHVAVRGGVQNAEDFKKLEGLAARIGALDGIEDVSYGQGWMKNYSAFVSAAGAAGAVLVGILLIGGLFVVGNSIRSSISARREEIEILELVGATASMIRRPYVAEGVAMGALASVLALAVNFAFQLWEKQALEKSFALGRLSGLFEFMPIGTLFAVVVLGGAIGGFGAWLTVRKINDGWAATSRLDEA